MKKYTVTVAKVGSIDLYANSPEEARKKAESSNENKMYWNGIEATDVEEAEDEDEEE
jgi:hypothetical protein